MTRVRKENRLMLNCTSTRRRLLGWIALALVGVWIVRPVIAADADADKPGPDKRVLIISVDGLRPDLLLRAEAPNMRALYKGGAFSFWAQTIVLGKTLPSHTSMLTGVGMEQHGVYWNEDKPPKRAKHEHPFAVTLFELAKEKGLSTALVAGKYKFVALAKPDTVDWLALAEPVKTLADGRTPAPVTGLDRETGLSDYDRKFSDDWTADEAVKIIKAHQPRVMFFHLARVDTVGHRKGWGSTQQIAAVEAADKALGKVFDAMRDKKLFDQTLIILSSDHGGYGNNHDGKDARGLHIPWIAHGPGIRANYDLTQIRNLVIRTEDTFATACHFLGIRPQEEIDGRAVVEAFEPASSVKP